MEKLFKNDVMSKLERVKATLNHQPVDRAALLEQLSFNPGVIADWTGKKIKGFDYTLDDICAACRQAMDIVMPPVASMLGTQRIPRRTASCAKMTNWTARTAAIATRPARRNPFFMPRFMPLWHGIS